MKAHQLSMGGIRLRIAYPLVWVACFLRKIKIHPTEKRKSVTQTQLSFLQTSGDCFFLLKLIR